MRSARTSYVNTPKNSKKKENSKQQKKKTTINIMALVLAHKEKTIKKQAQTAILFSELQFSGERRWGKILRTSRIFDNQDS